MVRLSKLVENAKNADKVFIVGAGDRGQELLGFLQREEEVYVEAFLDNNSEITGKRRGNIEIRLPYKDNDSYCIYIIALDTEEYRETLKNQLMDLGIKEKEILMYYRYRTYDYLSNLDKKYYQDELQEMYFERFGKKINWDHPTTYNEIINWEKLNIKDERRSRLADKLLAKEWIKGLLGEDYVAKVYGVWEDAADIDFDKLPEKFVLKANNGSGRNILVKNKDDIDTEEVRKTLNEWMHNNYAYNCLELHYKDIAPKIFCEEYLDGLAETVYDYNIYCFHGEPEYIWCIKGSHRPGCQASFYNKSWEMQPFSYGYPKDPVLAPRPPKLDEMLRLSRMLSKDYEHVRVDWYDLPDGRLLFGEITFATWGGLAVWTPEEYDAVFGKLI